VFDWGDRADQLDDTNALPAPMLLHFIRDEWVESNHYILEVWVSQQGAVFVGQKFDTIDPKHPENYYPKCKIAADKLEVFKLGLKRPIALRPHRSVTSDRIIEVDGFFAFPRSISNGLRGEPAPVCFDDPDLLQEHDRISKSFTTLSIRANGRFRTARIHNANDYQWLLERLVASIGGCPDLESVVR
jgi:hypothetical protein